jgi:hypothetical protein
VARAGANFNQKIGGIAVGGARFTPVISLGKLTVASGGILATEAGNGEPPPRNLLLFGPLFWTFE